MKTVAVAIRKNRLLNKKADSRETIESISILPFSLFDRMIRMPKESISTVDMKIRIYTPRPGSFAKAWTEERMPLRTRKVPSSDKEKVTIIRKRFQTLNIFRFSCTMTEWRKAVPTSHGINEAFSTGSREAK